MSAALQLPPSGWAYGPPYRRQLQRNQGIWGVSVLNRCSKEICINFESPLTAYKEKNIRLMESQLRGLHMTCRAAGMLNFARGGIKFTKSQKNKAKKPRAAKTDTGESIHDVIARLAKNPEFAEETALQLWPRLFGELELLGLCPEMDESDPGQKKWKMDYDYKNSQKPMSFGRFANLVSEKRNKKSR